MQLYVCDNGNHYQAARVEMKGHLVAPRREHIRDNNIDCICKFTLYSIFVSLYYVADRLNAG